MGGGKRCPTAFVAMFVSSSGLQGGVRHCRVPLTPALKEVLEVAYVSRIMSKNFRKEGQPEKERISRITGLEIEKVTRTTNSFFFTYPTRTSA